VETKGSLVFYLHTNILFYVHGLPDDMDPTHIQNITIKAAVITVSTTRSQEMDKSGRTIKKSIKEAGIPVAHYSIVPDDISSIRQELFIALAEANCIIITGGTGLTQDDCTIEAIAPLLEKKIDGFGELFRLKSFDEIGTRALLSRAVAGVIDGKAVFCIPGSVGAVTLATNQIILPEIRHILTHASR
jgi:molybdenum cofactor biosynthesis protein B